MFLLQKWVENLASYISFSALRVCWLLVPARFKARFSDKLRQQWRRALDTAPAASVSLQHLIPYTPIQLKITSNIQTVTWLRMGRPGVTAPFFDQICYRSWLSQIRPELLNTKIDSLIELHKIDPGLNPSGLIFHISHCGSTLVSNILSESANCLVLSEPSIISTLLHTFEECTPLAKRVDLLRSFMSVLGRPTSASHKHLFVKFSSWDVLDLDLIKKAYPGVPWIFLYRHPLEVAVSNHPGQIAWKQSKADPKLSLRYLGISDISKLSIEELSARVIAKCGEIALSGLDRNAMLVNYSELSESCVPRLLSFFRVEATAEELRRMRKCFEFYSKDPTKKSRYVDDSQKRIRVASSYLKEMVDRHAIETYEVLEQRRRFASQ